MAKPKRKYLYIHTINGRPGFYDGGQVLYATGYYNQMKGAESLEQIRAEQKEHSRWRNGRGFSDTRRLGYVKYLIQ